MQVVEFVSKALQRDVRVRFQMLWNENYGSLCPKLIGGFGRIAMSDPALRTYIGQMSFFSGLSDAQLDQLTAFASGMRYSSQQRLFKSDTDADKFYIIRDGKVGIEIPAIAGEPLRVQTLGNGGVLGWSWLIPPYRWLFDARALVASDIIAIDGVKLREQCDADPSLGYQLMKRFAVLMAERLQASRVAAIKQYAGN